MNHLDTLLNLAWAVLCIGALVRHAWCERQRSSPRSGSVRVLRTVAVFMVTLLLFPCISISDDYARARAQDAHADSSTGITNSHGNSGSLLLALQLEETEHIRPVVPFVLVLVLCCLLMMLCEESDSRSPMRWGTLGRAPPRFLILPGFRVRFKIQVQLQRVRPNAGREKVFG